MNSINFKGLICLLVSATLTACGGYPPSPSVCKKTVVDIVDQGPPVRRDYKGIWRTRDEITLKVSEDSYQICRGELLDTRSCASGQVIWPTRDERLSQLAFVLVDFGKTEIGSAMYYRFTSNIPGWNGFLNGGRTGDEKFGDWDYPFIISWTPDQCEYGTCTRFGAMDGFEFIWYFQDTDCLGEWSDTLVE